MTTFDSATHPLEFALIAARHLTFTDAQIFSLRQVAARYAQSEAADMKRSLEILGEARQLNQKLVCELGDSAVLEYPSFAVDYESVGRHDLAMVIIEDSLQVAKRLRLKPRTSMMIMVADACYAIGEVARCRELLAEIRNYYQYRKRRISLEDGPYDVLHSLYLKLGEVEPAKALIDKLQGLIKANALTDFVFYQNPFICSGEYDFSNALAYCQRYRYEDTLARIAGLLTAQGYDLLARCVFARVKTESRVFEGKLDVAIALLEAGKHSQAQKTLESVCSSTNTFFYYQPDRVQRLVSLLMPDHKEAAALLLDRVREEANGGNGFRDHYLRHTQLAGLVAAYSRDEAEALVDHVLDHPVTDLGHGGKGPKLFFNRTGVCILYELAMIVDTHKLRWEDNRIEQFRNYMAAQGS